MPDDRVLKDRRGWRLAKRGGAMSRIVANSFLMSSEFASVLSAYQKSLFPINLGKPSVKILRYSEISCPQVPRLWRQWIGFAE